jgi:predicted SAM-dependent methyltransferase
LPSDGRSNDAVLEHDMRRLHIGGQTKADGWEIFDAIPGPIVDHVGNANDLSRFPDGTFTAVYASHVAEHFDYVGELLQTIKEWYRVVAPSGKLYISVPDMNVLCRLFIDPRVTPEGRFMVMRMIFGGHTTPYDYHKVGLNPDMLMTIFQAAGFAAAEQVADFGFFHDTSRSLFGDVPISCNLIAYKGPLEKR